MNKIDRLFTGFALIFLILIGAVLMRGDQTYPMVVRNSLESEVVPLDTNQIVLEFNRTLDKNSVENGFSTTPEIPGKFSWIGRKMAYSFEEALTAGQAFSIELSGVTDTLGNQMAQPYRKDYRVASKALYYIDQEGRLEKFSLSDEKKETLSPEGFIVKDYEVHKNGSLIFLMSLVDTGEGEKSDLYKLDLENGDLEKILDGSKEFIFSLALAPNGEFLLVRKGLINQFDQSSLIDPGSLWIYDIGSEKWSKFWNTELYGSEFYFSPDSHYLVGRLITGDITIVPVEENAGEVVYLENYAGSYSLSPDGRKLIFVDFVDPFSPHDLLLKGNDGKTQELVSGIGQIQFPVFNADGNRVYFLMSPFENNFAQTGLVQFNPYHLYEYDLEAQQMQQLTTEDQFLEGFFTLSSDDQAVAFERYPVSEDGSFFDSELQMPQAEIWIYEIEQDKLMNTGISGSKPYLN